MNFLFSCLLSGNSLETKGPLSKQLSMLFFKTIKEFVSVLFPAGSIQISFKLFRSIHGWRYCATGHCTLFPVSLLLLSPITFKPGMVYSEDKLNLSKTMNILMTWSDVIKQFWILVKVKIRAPLSFVHVAEVWFIWVNSEALSSNLNKKSDMNTI